jgi:hypothetical protein
MVANGRAWPVIVRALMSSGPAHVFFNLWGETEPDLHLMKQEEQVTTSALEGPLLCQIR